jgi:hypothetical protein
VDAAQQHRRDVRRLMIVPLLLGILLIAGLMLLLIFLTPRQLTLVSNLMLTCMCLLPLVLCMTPLYFGAVLAVFGMSRVNGAAYKRLEGLRALSTRLAERTSETTTALNRRAINTGAALARLDPLFDVFNQPPAQDQGDGAKPDDRT